MITKLQYPFTAFSNSFDRGTARISLPARDLYINRNGNNRNLITNYFSRNIDFPEVKKKALSSVVVSSSGKTYEVLSYVLGGGTMGRVFLGFDEKGSPVAIKRPFKPTEEEAQSAGTALFDNPVNAKQSGDISLLDINNQERYLRLERRLSNRGLASSVVPIDYGIDSDAREFNIYEFANGVNLKEVIQSVRTLDRASRGNLARTNGLTSNQLKEEIIDEALIGLSRVTDAIVELDINKINHRDIKPSNILFNVQGMLVSSKLADFGICLDRKYEPESKSKTAGTMDYMAKEQMYAIGIDSRADVYSLCASIYELVSGDVYASNKASFFNSESGELYEDNVNEFCRKYFQLTSPDKKAVYKDLVDLMFEGLTPIKEKRIAPREFNLRYKTLTNKLAAYNRGKILMSLPSSRFPYLSATS